MSKELGDILFPFFMYAVIMQIMRLLIPKMISTDFLIDLDILYIWQKANPPHSDVQKEQEDNENFFIDGTKIDKRLK